MLYLVLQVVFASAFMLVIKWVQVRSRDDIITIGAINYIVAAIAISPIFFANTIEEVSPGAMWLGGSMGTIYFIAYFFASYCIRVVGAASTTVISVLSILFPITIAAVTWMEIPNTQQSLGISVALLALLLIGLRRGSPQAEQRGWVTPLVLLVFFLLCGLARLSQDAFKHVSTPDQRPTFVISAFTMAAIPSIVMLIYRGRRIQFTEFVLGAVMGLANVLQTHFILQCLEHFPGYVVFPMTSAGAIVLTTLVATGLLREQLSGQTKTGISLAVLALFILHWMPTDY